MKEIPSEAWRRRNGLPPLRRTLPSNAEKTESIRLKWERTWTERWELRGGKYYPKESKR